MRREIFYKFIRGLLGDEKITADWIEKNDGHLIDEALSDIKAEILKELPKKKEFKFNSSVEETKRIIENETLDKVHEALNRAMGEK